MPPRSAPSQPPRRSSAHWDPDRSLNYPPANDRYRPDRHGRDRDPSERHPTSHGNDRDSGDQPNPRRAPGTSEQARRMDQDKAASELARLHRQIYSAMVDKVKWTTKKEVELKSFQRREADYKKAGGAQFPAVADSIQRHLNHYKQQGEKCDTELAKVDALLDKITENIADLLVKALPVDEIKARQLVDVAKAEMEKAQGSSPTFADRFQKMEQHLASLQETQTAQATSLDSLRQENERLHEQATSLDSLRQENERLHEQATSLDSLRQENERLNERLRSRDALYETQVGRLAGQLTALETQHKELHRQLNSKEAVQVPELEALRKEKDGLETRVSNTEGQVAGLEGSLATRLTELDDFLQNHVRSQTSNNARDTAQGERMAELECRVNQLGTQISSLESLSRNVDDATLEEKMTVLERRVHQHDLQISSFDINEYSEAVDKLLAYPSWTALDCRLQQLGPAHTTNAQDTRESLDYRVEELTQQITNIQGITKGHDDQLRELTQQIVHLQGIKKDHHDQLSELTQQIIDLQDAKKGHDDKLSEITQTFVGIEGVKEIYETQFNVFMSQITNVTDAFVSQSGEEASKLRVRVEAMEARNATAARAPSVTEAATSHLKDPAAESGVVSNRMEAAETAISGLQNGHTMLRNGLDALRNELDERCAANEEMITNLDGQFQNMTTQEMAQIILDNLKRIETVPDLLDLQNIQARVTSIEKWQKEFVQRSNGLKDWLKVADAMQDKSGKHGLMNEDPAGRGKKRQRVEGLNGAAHGAADGSANGLAAQQTSSC